MAGYIQRLLGLIRGLFPGDGVRAQTSAVAAGGDIVNTTIRIGADEEVILERFKEAQQPLAIIVENLVTEVAREKGIDPTPLRAVLRKLGDIHVPNEEIPTRIASLADELIELRLSLQVPVQTHIDDNLRDEKIAALKYIDAGDFEQASKALERGRLAAQQLRGNASRSEAEFLAHQGQLDEIQFLFKPAAAKYGDAAQLVQVDAALSFQYLYKKATALQCQGEEFGDNDSLRAAISVWREGKRLRRLETAADDHMRAHNNLGSALYALGIRQSTNDLLNEVVAINREVLSRGVHGVPAKFWYAAHANLGSVLQALGEREPGIEKFTEAVEHFREGLIGINRETQAADWAGTQNNIGNSLKFIAQRTADERLFSEAIEAYRVAVEALPPTASASERAMLRGNLAAALLDFGAFKNQAEPMQDAIALLKDVIDLAPRERYPIQWARANGNLAAALNRLGLITNEIENFVAAKAAGHQALTVFSRENAPIDFATNVWGIGISDKMIAERTRSRAEAEEAVAFLSLAAHTIEDSVYDDLKPRIRNALAEAISVRDQL